MTYNIQVQNCMKQSVPVRVVRGHQSKSSYVGKVYTYDGLYQVMTVSLSLQFFSSLIQSASSTFSYLPFALWWELDIIVDDIGDLAGPLFPLHIFSIFSSVFVRSLLHMYFRTTRILLCNFRLLITGLRKVYQDLLFLSFN